MAHNLQLLVLLMVIVLCAKAAGALSVRLGQPAVFGEILVGLILGPTVLNLMHWHWLTALPQPLGAGSLGELLGAGAGAETNARNVLYLETLIRDFAEIGVLLLMFVAGMETDLVAMKKVGNTAFWAATGGVLAPLFAGAAAATAFGYPLFWTAIFIGTILTATSVSISAQTLMELGALRTREGTTILGAAVIDDVMGIILLGLVTALSTTAAATGAASGWLSVLWIVLKMALYFGVFWFAGLKLLPWLSEKARAVPASQALLAFVLITALFYAWAAEFFAGLAAITGSYLAGVLFAQTRHKAEIDRQVHPLTYSLFVPIFFVGIGLEANGRQLGHNLLWLAVILVVAIVTKAGGCFVGSRLSGFNSRESFRVGIGMISRGEVGLIIAGVGLSRGIISPEVFSAMIVMVLVTTMITPILLRFVFPRRPPQPGIAFESVGQLETTHEEALKQNTLPDI